MQVSVEVKSGKIAIIFCPIGNRRAYKIMPMVTKFGGNIRFYESTRTPLEAKKTYSRHKTATSRMSAHKKGAQTMKIRIYETDFEGNPRAFFYFLEKFSSPQNGEFFESQKEEHFHFSKNSPGETGTSF